MTLNRRVARLSAVALPGPLGRVQAINDPFALELAAGACPRLAWARLGASAAAAAALERRAVLRPLAKWRVVHSEPVAYAVSARASLELWPALEGQALRFDGATYGSIEACVVAGCLALALSRALGDAGECASVDLSALEQVAKDSSALVRRALDWSVEDLRVVLGAASQVHNVTALVGLTEALEFATRRGAVPACSSVSFCVSEMSLRW